MFIVIAPAKTYNGIEDAVILATDDIDSAKRCAKQTSDKFKAKGFDSWARRVKVKAPKTPAAMVEMAELIVKRASDLDWSSNGNSFEAQDLYEKAKTLRVRADELANPENSDSMPEEPQSVPAVAMTYKTFQVKAREGIGEFIDQFEENGNSWVVARINGWEYTYPANEVTLTEITKVRTPEKRSAQRSSYRHAIHYYSR